MFSSPPMNQRAKGRSHSRVFSNGLNQLIRSRASRSQNASKSVSASRYRSDVALACVVKAGSGGKVRASRSRFSISGATDRAGCPADGAGCSTATAASSRLDGRCYQRTSRRARSTLFPAEALVGSLGERIAFAQGRVQGWPAAGLPSQHHALWPRDLDPVLVERGEEPLPKLARGGPLVRGAHGAQDLQR